MQISPALKSNILDLYGTVGEVWLENLDEHILHLSSLWNFQFLQPMKGLSYNFVGLVKRNVDNKTAILKMSPPGGNLGKEMRWLNCIEKGVPQIYALDEQLNAYLMEHLVPGHSLKKLVKAGDDEGATRIICQTIRNLQSQHCNPSSFRHLSELSKSFPVLEGKFDGRLLSKATGLFHDLTNNRSTDVVLHGDLHHDNILASDSEWKAIDPHGYVGDPAAEVGALIRNALDCFPAGYCVANVIERRLQILSEELPFDKEKIRAWALCITVLSAAWSVEDHGLVPDDIQEIALAIDQASF